MRTWKDLKEIKKRIQNEWLRPCIQFHIIKSNKINAFRVMWSKATQHP